jgi:antitoxin HigA-1
MSKTLLPPIHPGEILREEFMVPLALSGDALATAFGVTGACINEIIQEKCGITADIALLFSCYFGNSAEFWLNLQQRYELECAGREPGCTDVASSACGASDGNIGREKSGSS